MHIFPRRWCVVHAYMQLWLHPLRDQILQRRYSHGHGRLHCQRVRCHDILEQGRERRHFLLHQRWHYWWYSWLLHVHVLRRRIQWYQLPDCRRLYRLLNLEQGRE